MQSANVKINQITTCSVQIYKSYIDTKHVGMQLHITGNRLDAKTANATESMSTNIMFHSRIQCEFMLSCDLLHVQYEGVYPVQSFVPPCYSPELSVNRHST